MADKKIIKFFKIALLFVIVVCLIQVYRAYQSSAEHKQQSEEFKKFIQAEKEDESEKKDESITETFESEEVSFEDYLKELTEHLPELYDENNDLVGWLLIEGTQIDNPVLQCENDYYLYRNFYGEDDKYGSLFVKEIADVKTPGTNIIVYGHNMKDGSMFGSLDEYRSKEFYREHSIIYFLTIEEIREYEVMAVFRTQLSEEDVFLYYQFYQADTKEDFLYFYRNVKELSIYDTEVTAEFGDTFLTLSTCDYFSKDGRFVVVAKRIS